MIRSNFSLGSGLKDGKNGSREISYLAVVLVWVGDDWCLKQSVATGD